MLYKVKVIILSLTVSRATVALNGHPNSSEMASYGLSVCASLQVKDVLLKTPERGRTHHHGR